MIIKVEGKYKKQKDWWKINSHQGIKERKYKKEKKLTEDRLTCKLDGS